MKKIVAILICGFLMISLVACVGSTGYSDKVYEEISEKYPIGYAHLSPLDETKFFEYKTEGISVGSVYYGYYYSENNEILVPDFYLSDNLGEKYEKDGGTYFGKPNNGTDWYFVKQLSDKWFYYELHWG